MSTRTKKPNISPVSENPFLKTTVDLHKDYDNYLRDETNKANEIKERILAKKQAEERRSNEFNSYVSKLEEIGKQNVYNPNEIDLKIKDLKELEKQIKEEIILQEKKKTEYVDEIFTNGELLINEIEEKKVKGKTEKSIIKKLIDFLFGF